MQRTITFLESDSSTHSETEAESKVNDSQEAFAILIQEVINTFKPDSLYEETTPILSLTEAYSDTQFAQLRDAMLEVKNRWLASINYNDFRKGILREYNQQQNDNNDSDSDDDINSIDDIEPSINKMFNEMKINWPNWCLSIQKTNSETIE